MIKSMLSTEYISIRIGIILSRFGIPPNLWTLMALISALFGFIALCYNKLPCALILFIISGVMDGIDGAVARVTGRVTSLGAFLDGVTDRYTEFLLYLGLLLYLQNFEIKFFVPTSIWISLLIFGSIMPSFIRAYADHRNVVTDENEQRRMGGILERPERLLLIYIGMFMGCFNNLWFIYIIALTSVFANITAFQRLYFCYIRGR